MQKKRSQKSHAWAPLSRLSFPTGVLGYREPSGSLLKVWMGVFPKKSHYSLFIHLILSRHKIQDQIVHILGRKILERRSGDMWKKREKRTKKGKIKERGNMYM
jgi:hypothetical protein